MKKMIFKPALLALAIAVSACSSVPTTTSTLEQARSDFAAAQNNPAVGQYAAMELKAATDALNAANTAAAEKESLEKIDQLAYIAKQKVATAQEVARAKQAEADIAKAGQQRDQIRLEARTAEAEAAKRAAEQAQAEAQAAQNQAANAEAQKRNAENAAAILAAQLAELHAKQTERGMVVTLGDVLFNVDQAVLTSQGMSTVQKLGQILTDNPDRNVLIEGFTDSTGSTAHNLELSQRRAESVRNALMQMGIASNRVQTRGYGEAYPVASNATAGDRQLNRRVEIVLGEAGAPVQARR
ncbi:OmpA family protein [Pseudoduganella rhizocola]|uniref:OmpA family protein n=1 Tax=Pseudoduganella rhizocola TaxID=3382643 RepID=UPI0038B497B0